MSDVVMAEPDWESRYRQEEQIVARIWTMLGNPSYEALVGRSIYDLIAELQAKAAAHDDLLAALKAALKAAVKIADEAREEWDKAPDGMRAGKILIALSGGCPGYRADIDAIHAAITRATRAGGE